MRIVKLFIAAAIPFVLLGCPDKAAPDPAPAKSAAPAATAPAAGSGAAAPAKSGGW